MTRVRAGGGKDDGCREPGGGVREEEIPRSTAGRRSAESFGDEVVWDWIGRKERGIAARAEGTDGLGGGTYRLPGSDAENPAGSGSTQNPAGLLRSVRMKTMIESLKEEADLLIIDTPRAECFRMRHCSAELPTEHFSWYIREQRKTGKSVRALEFFEDSQIPVCGYVLNGVQEGTTGYGYSSYGSYGYGKYGLRLRKVRLWERKGTPEQ